MILQYDFVCANKNIVIKNMHYYLCEDVAFREKLSAASRMKGWGLGHNSNKKGGGVSYE